MKYAIVLALFTLGACGTTAAVPPATTTTIPCKSAEAIARAVSSAAISNNNNIADSGLLTESDYAIVQKQTLEARTHIQNASSSCLPVQDSGYDAEWWDVQHKELLDSYERVKELCAATLENDGVQC